MSSIVALVRKLKIWNFRHKLEKKHRAKVRRRSPNYVLTKEQEAQIREFYAPYAKVDLGAHNFYTEKTGQFHVNYLPDDLYYSRIDSQYNDWWECAYVDNKCFYSRMFQGIRHPEAVASRVGGLWYDGSGNLIRRSQLDALEPMLREGCAGQLPEIYGGDFPCESRGCFAQAWSVGEMLRVFEAIRAIEEK